MGRGSVEQEVLTEREGPVGAGLWRRKYLPPSPGCLHGTVPTVAWCPAQGRFPHTGLSSAMTVIWCPSPTALEWDGTVGRAMGGEHFGSHRYKQPSPSGAVQAFTCMYTHTYLYLGTMCSKSPYMLIYAGTVTLHPCSPILCICAHLPNTPK